MKARLIRVGWVLLTLTSLWAFGFNLYWIIQYFANPPGSLVAALHEMGLALGVLFALNLLFSLIIYVCYFVVAQLIILRGAGERFTVLAAVVLLAFGTVNAVPIIPEYLQFFFHAPWYFAIPFYLNNILGWTLLTPFLIIYPDGKFVPRWTLWLGIVGAMVSFAWASNAETFSMVQGAWAILLTTAAAIEYGGILYAQVWRYRHHYNPLQKQQVKWFLYGLVITALMLIAVTPITPFFADPTIPPTQLVWAELLYMLFGLGFVALPIAVGFAILRYRLWDIDVIIRRTISYGILAALLAAIYFGSVIVLQQLLATILGDMLSRTPGIPDIMGDSTSGQRSEAITVLSTLAIAALFIPLRNRIQGMIDKRFYRKKYDAQKVLHEFSVTVRDETDLEQLTGSLLGVVNETMQPRSVSVWLAPTDDGRRRTDDNG